MLPLLVLLAVAVRALSWSRVVLVMNDGPDFLWQAQQFLDGQPLAAIGHPYHPLYGWLVAGASRLGLNLLDAGFAVSLVGGVLTVIGAWHLTRHVFPDRAWAPAAGALTAALHTRAIRYAADVQSDGLFMGLFALGAWALAAAHTRGGCGRRMVAAGLLTGAAFLTRPEGLFLGVVVLAWAVAGLLHAETRGPGWRGLALFGGAVTLAVLPYALAIHELTGHWGVSMKPSMRAFGLTDVGNQPPLDNDSPLNSPIVPRIKRGDVGGPPGPAPAHPPHPEALDGRTSPAGAEPPAATPAPRSPADAERPAATPAPHSAARPPRRAAFGPALATPAADWWTALSAADNALRRDGLVLLLCGLVPALRRRRGMVALWAVLLVAYLAICARHAAHAHVSNRHLVPLIVLSFPWMGAGTLWLVRSGWPGRLLAGALLFTLAQAGARDYDADRGPRLQALQWVAEHGAPDRGIAVRRRRDGFYAQRHVLVVNLPCDDDVLVGRMRRYAVDYLVLGVERVQRDAPHWLDDTLFLERARFGDADGPGDEVVVLALP